ncbi:MAG TPA: hypothetical protein VH915_14120 [Pedococcus sp.]|jgi:hypothetical protein
MTPDEARRLYLGALLAVEPGADLVPVVAGASVRRSCHLDAARFRSFVDEVGRRARLPLRHDDADADCLATLDEAIPFLVNEAARVRLLGLQQVG